MLASIGRKLFGSRNERILKRYQQVVSTINDLEPQIVGLSEGELKSGTAALRQRLQEGTNLDDLLPEAFARVREAAKRVLNMRHFDVQLIGGMVLHHGKIAEMRTGEGKTLVATLAAYLNALPGRGVHIVTVNDYLAKRDAEWMGPIYAALGLTVGVIVADMSRAEKKAAYQCDVIYGTNNEFGFDYLRDNMAFAAEERMQQALHYAIVDEVDSILIDEARTPLIISGPDQDSSALYKQVNALVAKLQIGADSDADDFTIDEKAKQVYLTEEGHQNIEAILVEAGLLKSDASVYDPENIGLMHHVYAALRARVLFKKDVDYIVSNDEVVIVDEHTGRTMPGRRWSEGLHQAVEAKEGVTIQNENQTLASITFQNYFRLYNKLSGMTGTADTEAYEFQQIYGLEVIVMPTNRPSQRVDHGDKIYLTQEEKFNAIVEDIKDCVQRKQPVLVGTISIETSEYLSKRLGKHKIKHQVLNAKFHEQEAEIIAEAGRPSAVTIATNMAGRGTDIVLGGNLEAEMAKQSDLTAAQVEALRASWKTRHQAVLDSGGLHIIGTERHESRRIDNQLRGRSGRQGDPGSTSFYLSVEDNLMRIFISDSISAFLNKIGMEEGEAITHPMITRAVENAQKKVEGYNFDIRKQLLDFDDVANEQRKVIYSQRDVLMTTDNMDKAILQIQTNVIDKLVKLHMPADALPEAWDIAGLEQVLSTEFAQSLQLDQWLDEQRADQERLRNKLVHDFQAHLQAKFVDIDTESKLRIQKMIVLGILDNHWKEHLATMDYMRQSIHLRGYAQKDPKQEYKREAFTLFTHMLDSIDYQVLAALCGLDVKTEELESQLEECQELPDDLQYKHEGAGLFAPTNGGDTDTQMPPAKRSHPKVGRNAPCPCGSGKKFKHCHGTLSQKKTPNLA